MPLMRSSLIAVDLAVSTVLRGVERILEGNLMRAPSSAETHCVRPPSLTRQAVIRAT